MDKNGGNHKRTKREHRRSDFDLRHNFHLPIKQEKKGEYLLPRMLSAGVFLEKQSICHEEIGQIRSPQRQYCHPF